MIESIKRKQTLDNEFMKVKDLLLWGRDRYLVGISCYFISIRVKSLACILQWICLLLPKLSSLISASNILLTCLEFTSPDSCK